MSFHIFVPVELRGFSQHHWILDKDLSCKRRKKSSGKQVPVFFGDSESVTCKTYPCSWQGDSLRFTVDFASGFTCCDSRTQTVLWSFRFSQLRASSDDGKARLKLLFQHLHTRQVETKELEFPDLTAVLHCVHAFLTAKVASLDPGFAGSQGLSRKPPGSS